MKRLVESYAPGLAAYWRSVRDGYKYKHAKPYKTLFGFSLYGEPGLDTQRQASDEIDSVRRALEPADSALVDVGANVGLFSCFASSLGRPVVAIEPNARNVQLLCRNVLLNSYAANVEVLPVGLSAAVGVMPLYGGGQGASLNRGWGGMRSTYSTLVPVTTLDRVLAGRLTGRPLLVKMDVEGHEYDVLLGARETLARRDVTWIVEHGLTENFDGVNPHYVDLFELFWSYGYAAHALAPRRLLTHGDVRRWAADGKQDVHCLNYIFTKAG